MPKFSKSADYPHGLDVAQLRKLNTQLDSAYPNVVNIFFRSLFTQEERESRRFKWLMKFRNTDEDQVPMQPALVEYLDILEKEDLREELKQVTIPIQYINGRGDEICHTTTVNYIKTLQPNARYDFFDKCGHFPFLSQPHEFNQVVADFILPKGRDA
jgi:pimeloyl-[acyl-carrier protein] methyl ester esterase